MVQVGSPMPEVYTPAGLDRIRSVSRRRPRRPKRSATKCEKPAPAEDFLFRDILCAPTMGAKVNLADISGNRNRVGVPRWRLAREGHSRMNDLMPLFGSWAKVVLSDVRLTM